MKSKEKLASKSARIGIRELARELGISTGTVDRALHDKPGIHPETRRKVLALARQWNYRPNLAARSLVSKKKLSIGVSLPQEIAYFYDHIREGIHDEAGKVEALGVQLVYQPIRLFGHAEAPAIDELLQEDVQGLIISPGCPQQLEKQLAQAAQRKIAVMCVATDAPAAARLAAVTVDSVMSGRIAGELLGQWVSPGGKAAIFTGMRATRDHAEKVTAFEETFGTYCEGGTTAEVVELHDSLEEAYRKSRMILRRHRDLRGIYVTTANSLPVVRAVEEAGMAGTTRIIATDLFPKLASLIQRRVVAATIYQRPREQGRLAFRTLYRYLAEGVMPSPEIRLEPVIVMRSNLPASPQEDSAPESKEKKTARTDRTKKEKPRK